MKKISGIVVTQKEVRKRKPALKKNGRDKYIITAGAAAIFLASFLIMGFLEGEENSDEMIKERVRNRDVIAQINKIEKTKEMQREKENMIRDEVFLDEKHSVSDIADEIIGNLKKRDENEDKQDKGDYYSYPDMRVQTEETGEDLFTDFYPEVRRGVGENAPITHKEQQVNTHEVKKKFRRSLIAWKDKNSSNSDNLNPVKGTKNSYSDLNPDEKKSGDVPGKFIYNNMAPVKINEGSIIDGVLMNRVVTDRFESPVTCRVTRDFCDDEGKYIIIPANSKILGTAASVVNEQNSRLIIAFHKIILPNGFSVIIEKKKKWMQALGRDGSLGLKGKKNSHLFKKYGSALFYGLLSGAGRYFGGSAGLRNGTNIFIGKSSDNFELLNERIATESMSVVPTIKLDAGTEVKIFIGRDIEISPFSLISERKKTVGG